MKNKPIKYIWIKLKNGNEKFVPENYKELEKKESTFGTVEVMRDGKRIVRST